MTHYPGPNYWTLDATGTAGERRITIRLGPEPDGAVLAGLKLSRAQQLRLAWVAFGYATGLGSLLGWA